MTTTNENLQDPFCALLDLLMLAKKVRCYLFCFRNTRFVFSALKLTSSSPVDLEKSAMLFDRKLSRESLVEAASANGIVLDD